MNPYNCAKIPLEAQYLYRRGRELMDQQKEDVAMAYLRQAVFIAPGFSKAYREIGNCLSRLGRSGEASVYYLKASRMDPLNGGTPIEKITVSERGKDQPIPGSCLTFLVW